jgi:hypothetical protein
LQKKLGRCFFRATTETLPKTAETVNTKNLCHGKNFEKSGLCPMVMFKRGLDLPFGKPALTESDGKAPSSNQCLRSKLLLPYD